MAGKAASRNKNGPPDFCDYGVAVLNERLEKMLAHTEGAASGRETRPIHQMRVWSRRSRSALDVFGPCFAENEAAFADVVQEVKTVTRALGAARDLDVMLETLQTRMEALPSAQQGGVESLLDYLRAQREARQQAVTSSVQHLVKRRLTRQLHHLAARQGYKAAAVELPTTPASAISETTTNSEPAGLAPASTNTPQADANEYDVHRNDTNVPSADVPTATNGTDPARHDSVPADQANSSNGGTA